jgi:probable HAF family extracellular repeat protein
MSIGVNCTFSPEEQFVMKLNTAFIGLMLVLLVSPLHAEIVNGGFENPSPPPYYDSIEGWNQSITLGGGYGFIGIGSPGHDSQQCVVLQASAMAYHSIVHISMGINQLFHVNAGQILSFDAELYESYNGIQIIYDPVTLQGSSGNSYYEAMSLYQSSWETYSFPAFTQDGDYLLSFNQEVMATWDPFTTGDGPAHAEAMLRIDNVQVPEPGAITLLIAFGLCLAACAYRRSKRSFCRQIVAVFVFSSCIVGMSQAATYSITDLGTYGDFGIPTGVNNSGQICGHCWSSELGADRAFLWQNGIGKQDLGTLEGNNSAAYGINNSGQVVGSSGNGDIGGDRAFIWQSNTGIQAVGSLGGIPSGARAINDNGQVVGSAGVAFFWQSGSAIQYIAGGYDAYAINDSGQIAGCSVPPFLWMAFPCIWQSSSETPQMIEGLGAIGPVGIDNSGRVLLNYTSSSGYNHAFFWQNGEMRDLGTLGLRSEAFDTNDSGQVVGYSYIDDSNSGQHAFLVDGSGPMQDLNDLINSSSGWTLYDAKAISDNGLIVGYGTIGGNSHVYLLTPVPEPSTIILLGIGAIGLVAYTWQRRNRPT